MGPPHSPQLNGMAERFNRTILDRLLPSLLQANLPVKFWEDAAHHALTSLNLSPSRANENCVAPDSLWTNVPLSYKRLQTFGCKVFCLITGPARKGKLQSKSSDCLLLHTLPDGDGWMVWDLSLKGAVKTHDIVLHEDVFPGLGKVSNCTSANWMTWASSLTPSLSASQHYQPTNLHEQRLSASIHNPRNRPPSVPDEDPISSTGGDDSSSISGNDQSVTLENTSPSPSATPSSPPSPARQSSPSPPAPTHPRRGTQNRTAPERYGFNATARSVTNALFDQDVPLLTLW